MKILVTGSLGCLGSALTTELKRRGYEVFGLDISHHYEDEHGFDLSSSLPGTYFKCDIAEYRPLRRVIEYIKPDLIFNTAAQFGRWNGETNYEDLWKTNVIGLKHLLKLQEEFGFKLAHFSSSEVYGDYDYVMKEEVLDEIQINQLNDYAISKWVNELQIKNSKHPELCAIFRFFNVYGPGEQYSPYRSVNCRMIYSALHSLPFVIYRGHTRSSTYIDDAINAISNLVKLDNHDFAQVFNIGSSNLHTIEHFAKLVLKETGVNSSLFKYKDSEPNTTKDKVVDIDRAKKYLGLKTTVSLEEGTTKTIAWMKEKYQ